MRHVTCILALAALLGLLWGCNGHYAGGVGQGLQSGLYGPAYAPRPTNCYTYQVGFGWQTYCY